MLKKRNRLSNPQTHLEAKAMLAAPATPAADAPTTAKIGTPSLTEAKPVAEAPDKLELGENFGAGFQAGAAASAAQGVEIGVRANADGKVQPGSNLRGTADRVFFGGEQQPGGSTIHTHPQPTFDSNGAPAGEVFLDADGKDGNGNKPVAVENGPSGRDIRIATTENNRPHAVVSGETVFAHLPGEEGKHRGEVDLTGQRTKEEQDQARAVFDDQIKAVRDHQIEAGEKRARAEADRAAGDGKGGISVERTNEIERSAQAAASEAAGGTSFVGPNDGSGTLYKNERNPAVT